MPRKRTLKPAPPPSPYVVERWKRTRFWSITLDGNLIALCVYKKGATSVVAYLDERDALRRQLFGHRLVDNLIEPATRPLRRIHG